MKTSLTLEPNDIKRMISRVLHVDIKSVKSTGYSYYVETGESESIEEYIDKYLEEN